MNKDIQYYKDEADRYRNMFYYKLQDVNTRAAIKEDERLYRKVGKKFVPINDPYAYDGLRNGFWLIQVKDGCTSICSCIFSSVTASSVTACSVTASSLTASF